MRHAEAIAARARATAWRLSLLWGAVFFPVGLHLPYFPVWLASRGLSDGAVALVMAAPPILRVAATPLFARAADKRGIAGVLALCAGVVFLGYATLAATGTMGILFVVAILTIVAQGSMSPLADALTLSEIRRFAILGSRQIEYGRMRVCASASVLVMMLGSGPLIAVWPGEGIVRILAIMAIAPVVVTAIIALKTRRLRPALGQGRGLVANPADRTLVFVAIAAAALTQSSHAEIYSFGTLQWQAQGFAPLLVGVAWGIGITGEMTVFLTVGRFVATPRRAALCLCVGAAGAMARWTAMAAAPPPGFTLILQLMHGLSFATTYIGAVLLLGALGGGTHRARIQGWLAATSSLSLAGATLLAGYLTPLVGARAYLGMALLAGSGFGLALVAWRLVGAVSPTASATAA